MKKIITQISKSICFVMVVAVMFMVSGCGANNKEMDTNSNQSETINSGTKAFYEKKGYTEIYVSESFDVSGEVVNFSDGSTYALIGSFISLEYRSEEFEKVKSISNVYLDAENNEVLSKIKIGEEEYSFFDINLSEIMVSVGLTVEPVYEKYSVIGVALWADLEEEITLESAKVELEEGSYELLYVVAEENIFNADDFKSNTTYAYDRQEETLTIIYEFDMEPLGVYIVIETEDGTKIVIEMEKNEDTNTYEITTKQDNQGTEQTLYKIEVKLTEDLTTSSFK